MQHYHVGMDDKVFRCSTASTTAAKHLNNLVHGVAMDLEDGCKSMTGRCGVCGWCRSADAVWDTFRTQVVVPLVRAVLDVGQTAIWEIEVPVTPSQIIWVGPAEGSYAECSAVNLRNPPAFNHITVS